MNKKEIVYLNVNEIYPHPDNPRKSIGDISELVESIKKNGIMQNLTVVPGHHFTSATEKLELEDKLMAMKDRDDAYWELRGNIEKGWTPTGYTLIIGHRRCAAAKEAGLTELPCIITEMDENTQFSTMLEENMQRTDLTIYEQAQGFQMMLDLGNTEEQIAEKTGFSKTTIRHRLNIAKLDKDIVKTKEDDDSFQLSLKDLYELEKIDDIEKRNHILKTATSSRDIVWKAKSAATEIRRTNNAKLLVDRFKAMGFKKAPKDAEQEWSDKYETVKKYDLEDDVPDKITYKKPKDDPMYVVGNYNVRLVVPTGKKERTLSEYEIKQKEVQKAKKELKEKEKIMYSNIEKCITYILDGQISPVKETVDFYKSFLKTLTTLNYQMTKSEIAEYKTGTPLYSLSLEKERYDEFNQWYDGLSEIHTALVHLLAVKNLEIHGYNADYKEEYAARVKAVVDFLKQYGFSLSEEEEQLLDGTHELYK